MWKCSMSMENPRIHRTIFSEVLILFRAFWGQDGRDLKSGRTNMTIWSSSAWSYLPQIFSHQPTLVLIFLHIVRKFSVWQCRDSH